MNLNRNPFFTEFIDKISLELIDYYRYNFPLTWQVFRNCKIEFIIETNIQDRYCMLILFNKETRIQFDFLNDPKDGDILRFWDPKNHSKSFEIQLDLALGFENLDAKILTAVKSVLFPKTKKTKTK